MTRSFRKRRLDSRRPLPSEMGTPLGVRLRPKMQSPLDARIDPLGPKLSRSGAVCLILKDQITGRDHLWHREDSEGAN